MPPLFDATKVPLAGDRQLWPKGKYRVVIATSEQKASKSGQGQIVIFGLKAMDGTLQGSTLSHNINFLHSNAEAQRIGQQELSSICHATKILQPEAWTQLHGRPFTVDVDQEFMPDKDNAGNPLKDDKGTAVGKTYNRVNGYFNEDGSAIVGASTNGAAAPAAKEAPPEWAKPVAPVQPVQPTPPVVDTRLFHVCHAGKVITGATPIDVEAVRALNISAADPSFLLCENGKTDWVGAVNVLGSAPAPAAPAPAAAPAAPSGTTPWLQPKA